MIEEKVTFPLWLSGSSVKEWFVLDLSKQNAFCHAVNVKSNGKCIEFHMINCPPPPSPATTSASKIPCLKYSRHETYFIYCFLLLIHLIMKWKELKFYKFANLQKNTRPTNDQYKMNLPLNQPQALRKGNGPSENHLYLHPLRTKLWRPPWKVRVLQLSRDFSLNRSFVLKGSPSYHCV